MTADTTIGDGMFVFSFNGAPVTANTGDTVAAALISNGIHITRTTAKGSPRGPFCMMGACYDCLIELDGVTLQACMLTATPDMQIRSAVSTETDE